jgi:hypothetical protein
MRMIKMRMLRPSPGEVVDRQTILELKAQYGQSLDQQKTIEKVIVEEDKKRIGTTVLQGASKINLKPFLDEHEALQKYLEKDWFPMIATSEDKQKDFDSLYEQLSETNHDLWKLEDQARILVSAPDKYTDIANRRAAEVLFTINASNDRRAELVKKINAIWGMNTIEKLHYI